jgi:hypothetical protein
MDMHPIRSVTVALLALGVAFLAAAPLQASEPPLSKSSGPGPQALPQEQVPDDLTGPATTPGTAAPNAPAQAQVPPSRDVEKAPSEKPVLPRLNIVLDPKTPLADLLPRAPRVQGKTVNLFKVDLARVPEVTFQEPLSRKLTKEKATYEIALQLAKIRLLNQNKTDAFLEALISKRADLQGMPFVMGDACRTTGDRAKLFGCLALGVRLTMAGPEKAEIDRGLLSPVNAEEFWQTVRKNIQDAKKNLPKLRAVLGGDEKALDSLDSKEDQEVAPSKDCGRLGEDVDAACVTALMQVLAAESVPMRQGLVKFLSEIPHAEATRALARLALFSSEDEVRRQTIEALKGRRQQDYQAILMQGFRYPLPEVARRAAEAVARLQCKDLVPQLVSLLEEPDPRLPAIREVNHNKVPVVRELVRVNHHRNCILCHAPATVDVRGLAESTGGGALKAILTLATTAAAPLPTEPLPPPSQEYDPSKVPADLLVRIDTTYLRQDFSLLQPVADAAPWPDRQRFDFFVRSRILTEREAEEYRRQAPVDRAGKGTPYQRAILFALRELTGRDAPPTA